MRGEPGARRLLWRHPLEIVLLLLVAAMAVGALLSVHYGRKPPRI